jgi:hypothetical protein
VALSHQEVNNFFDRVEKELEGVPPENIWNYDETNLTDDPGAKIVIFKRGVKYAEQIRNHSKSAISMVFCGNAADNLVPPYIDCSFHFCPSDNRKQEIDHNLF